MDNKDLIKQYIDTGQAIGRYQFNRLSDNMKVTYLRKRIIASQQDEDYKLSRYEIFGAPESYQPIIIKYLLTQMDEYFIENMGNVDDEIFSSYGAINPVINHLLTNVKSIPFKTDKFDSRVDNYIIAFTQDEKFMKFMNKATAYRILLKCDNTSRIASYLGDIGLKYKYEKMQNIAKAAEEVIYSNSPKNLIEFLGGDKLINYFKNMEFSDKAHSLSNAGCPKDMLPILGYETMDYIKQEIANGHQNLVHHLLNDANNNDDMEDIFDEYGIDHSNLTKYYTRDKD